MRMIGCWIRTLDDEEFVPPQELVAEYDPAEREVVAGYLDAGRVFAVHRCFWRCWFCCEDSSSSKLGHRELTDGEWVWPDTLSHYVRVHSVRLPEEFVANVHAHGGVPPAAVEGKWEPMGGCDAEGRLPDVSYWIEWCRRSRSGHSRGVIAGARERAGVLARQLRADRIAEYERKHGVSNADCRWAGCPNKALNGSVFCAGCGYGPSLEQLVREPYRDLRVLRGED